MKFMTSQWVGTKSLSVVKEIYDIEKLDGGGARRLDCKDWRCACVPQSGDRVYEHVTSVGAGVHWMTIV